MTMSIAKALKVSSRLAGNIARITRRASQHTSWIDGKEPEFKFDELVEERAKLVEELTALKAAIDKANATTTLEFEGRTLSIAQAIRLERELCGEKKFLSELNLRYGEEQEHVGYDRDTHAPVYKTVTWKSVMTEAERAAKVDALQARIEDMNDAIDEANARGRVEV